MQLGWSSPAKRFGLQASAVKGKGGEISSSSHLGEALRVAGPEPAICREGAGTLGAPSTQSVGALCAPAGMKPVVKLLLLHKNGPIQAHGPIQRVLPYPTCLQSTIISLSRRATCPGTPCPGYSPTLRLVLLLLVLHVRLVVGRMCPAKGLGTGHGGDGIFGATGPMGSSLREISSLVTTHCCGWRRACGGGLWGWVMVALLRVDVNPAAALWSQEGDKSGGGRFGRLESGSTVRICPTSPELV